MDLSPSVMVVSPPGAPRFKYCRLVDHFDGGDLVPSPLAWRATADLLESLRLEPPDAPAVVPTADGGVQLEWHRDGTDVEVYVEPDGAVSFWCAGPQVQSLVAKAVDRRLTRPRRSDAPASR